MINPEHTSLPTHQPLENGQPTLEQMYGPDIMQGTYGPAVYSDITQEVTPVETEGMLRFIAATRRELVTTKASYAKDHVFPETNTIVDYSHEALKWVRNFGGDGKAAVAAIKHEQHQLHASGKLSAVRELTYVGTEIVAAMNRIAVATGKLEAEPRQVDRYEARVRRRLLESYNTEAATQQKARRIEKSLQRLEVLRPQEEQKSRTAVVASAVGRFVTKLFGKR